MPGKKKPLPKESTVNKQQQNLGIKTAKTILAELKLADNVVRQKSHANTSDGPAEKQTFLSHQKEGEQQYPTRDAVFDSMTLDEETAKVFCYITLITGSREQFDIDHVFPRAAFNGKVDKLLTYLNETSNKDFARAFMGEFPKDDGHQEKIGDYFVRESKKIKAKKWLYDSAYNSINNLIPLIHYINRVKSCQNPDDWFDGKEILVPLKKELEDSGGIHDGVIMQQVFKTTLSSDNSAMDFVTIDGTKRYLHEGTGVGLGEFIVKWFKANASKTMDGSKKISKLYDSLNKLLTEEYLDKFPDDNAGSLKGNDKKFKLNKLLSLLKALTDAKFDKIVLSQSSTDSEVTEQARQVDIIERFSEGIQYMHISGKIRKALLDITDSSYKNQIKGDLYSVLREHGFHRYDEKTLQKAADEFEVITSNHTSDNRIQKKEDLDKLVTDIKNSVDPLIRAEEQVRTEAEGRVKAEEQVRTEAEGRVKAEEQARSAEERARAAEMKLQQLEELQKAQSTKRERSPDKSSLTHSFFATSTTAQVGKQEESLEETSNKKPKIEGSSAHL